MLVLSIAQHLPCLEVLDVGILWGIFLEKNWINYLGMTWIPNTSFTMLRNLCLSCFGVIKSRIQSAVEVCSFW